MASECPKPGVYRDMPYETYADAPGKRGSRLKLIDHSAAAYCECWPLPDTAAMAEGRAFHVFALEPERFAREYTVGDGPINDRTGKPFGRDTAKWAAWAETLGTPLVTTFEAERWERMRGAIRADTDAAGALSNGEAEVSVFWQDADTGLLLKCRIDWLAGLALADLKTTKDASPVGFGIAAMKLGYLASAAMALDGMSAVTGEKYSTYTFVAVEKTPPYKAQAYYLDAAQVALGRLTYKRWLAVVAECEASGKWPAGSGTIQKLWLPNYAYRDADGLEVDFDTDEDDAAADSVGPLGF